MSRSSFITLNERKFEMYYSTWAMRQLTDLIGGDLMKIGEWLSEGDQCNIIEKYSKVIAILINGGIAKSNADIDFGFAEGEKKPFIKAEYIMMVISAGELLEYQADIFGALNGGNDFEIPENIKMSETDIDLVEIENEKNPEGRAG